MNINIRIPKVILNTIIKDLMRPHAYAAERIGFILGKLTITKTALILISKYQSVADNNYINNPRVGACINSDAIRQVMQISLTDSLGVFHVHLHEYGAIPAFSSIDLREIARLIPSLQAVAPGLAHGALVFNKNNCAAKIWLPKKRVPTSAARISIVGWPMQFFSWR
ncbi:MAG: hypothetical protein PHD29_05935 [bacterium]|nr:hypothetical protein [bacterium]